MSKTAYVVRHIHFENAGILEPLLIERGFTLEYIEAPLAETDLCPNQAFAIGNHILGLQFHLEANPTVIESWLVGHCTELCNAGIDIPKIREDARVFSASLPAAGKKAMTAWLDSNNL